MSPRESPDETGRGTSGALAAFAAVLPLVFTFCGCGLFPFLGRGRGVAGAGHAIEEMGVWFFILVGLTFVSVLGACALLFMAGRGMRVPSAIVIFVACLPWLGGLAGMRAGLHMVTEALQHADASSRAMLMAVGVSEASRALQLGTWLSGALLAATALGLSVAALGQRAPDRKPFGAVLGVAALPMAALAVYGLLPSPVTGLGLLLSAAIAVVSVGAGAAAAGRDEPHARSAALAAAVPLAAGLSLVATAIAVGVSGRIEVFAALAGAAPDSRAALVGAAAQELMPLVAVKRWAFPLALVPAVAVAGWVALRARPGLGQLAGGVGAVIVAAMVMSADSLVANAVEVGMRGVNQLPWTGQMGFTPIAFEPEDAAGSRSSDGAAEILVVGDQVIEVGGAPMGRLGEDGLAEALRELRERRETLERMRGSFFAEEEPAWLRDERGPDDGAMFARRDTHDTPELVAAVDARLGAEPLRQLAAVARGAGYRSLVAVGSAGAPQDSARLDEVRAALPFLVGMLDSTLGARVVLQSGVRPGAPDEDPRLLHAVVGAAPPERARTRTGASGEPPALAPIPSWDDRGGDDLAPIYLGLAGDATAASLFRTAMRAQGRGLVPVLVEREIPGSPDEDRSSGPMPGAEGTIGLGNLGIIGGGAADPGARAPRVTTGATEVRGSLSRDVIQRVIRRHINEVRACYDRALARDPSLSGRVLVRFTIDASGAVSSAEVQDSDLGDASVEACIQAAARRWRFPEPAGGGIVIVTYPFVFTTAP